MTATSRNIGRRAGAGAHQVAASLIAGDRIAPRCRWCSDDLEHCHECLVVHVVGEVHCMDAQCSTPPDLHHLVVACSDFGCGCAETVGADAFVGIA